MADEPIYFGIKEVRELSFSIDQNAPILEGQQFGFRYHVQLKSLTAEETVTFTIEASFLDNATQVPFVQGKSYTVFSIQNMKKYSRTRDGEEAIDFPDPLWATLFGIAYTHARALLAVKTAGTRFSTCIMPLIDPASAFRQVFAKEYARNKS